MKADELLQWIVYSLLCCWNFAALLVCRRMATYYPSGRVRAEARDTAIKIGLLLFAALFILLLCGYGAWAAAWNVQYGSLYHSATGLSALFATVALALITVLSGALVWRERTRRQRYLATGGIEDLLSAGALARLAALQGHPSDNYLGALAERLRWLAERAERDEPLIEQLKIVFDESELETLTTVLADASQHALRRIHAEITLMRTNR